MEWGNLPKQTDMTKEIEDMISFLENRKYAAFLQQTRLNRTNWSKTHLRLIFFN